MLFSFFVGLLAVIYTIPPNLPLIREACGNAPHCSPLAKYKTYIQPIGSTASQFESRYKEFFVLENITHLSHLSHQPYSPTLANKAQKK